MVKKEERARMLSGLELRVITEEDSDRVLEFLAKHYSNQHPLREIFGRKRIQAKVKDGVSLGYFVKGTNELAAVLMNSVATKKNHCTEPEWSDPNKNEKAMMDFTEFVEGDLFKDLKTEKILWLSMGAVAENYRGLNLVAEVDHIRDQLAASKGCEYLASLGVSNFPLANAVKQGFITLREVNYSDYVDPKTGLKPALKLSPIHTRAALVYKKVVTSKPNPSKL